MDRRALKTPAKTGTGQRGAWQRVAGGAPGGRRSVSLFPDPPSPASFGGAQPTNPPRPRPWTCGSSAFSRMGIQRVDVVGLDA